MLIFKDWKKAKDYFSRKSRSSTFNTAYHCQHLCVKCHSLVTHAIEKHKCQIAYKLTCNKCSGKDFTDKELEEVF